MVLPFSIYTMYGKIYSETYYFSNSEQLYLWGLVLNNQVDIRQFITNPFRTDNDAGCYLEGHDNKVYLTDWAFPEYNSYTVFTAISILKQCNIFTAYKLAYSYLKGIMNFNSNVHISTDNNVKPKNKGKTELSFRPWTLNGKPSWSPVGKQYWQGLNITKLSLETSGRKVYDVHHYIVNGNIKIPETYPCFAYTFSNGHMKLYQPYSKEDKWIGSVDKNDVWSFTGFPPTEDCIITKSYKDANKVFDLMELDTYAFMNEGTHPDHLLEITDMYNNVFILYDNDKAGIDAAMKLAKIIPNAICVFYPKDLGKDTCDVYEKLGNNTIEILEKMLYGTELT